MRLHINWLTSLIKYIIAPQSRAKAYTICTHIQTVTLFYTPLRLRHSSVYVNSLSSHHFFLFCHHKNDSFFLFLLLCQPHIFVVVIENLRANARNETTLKQNGIKQWVSWALTHYNAVFYTILCLTVWVNVNVKCVYEF